MEGQDEKQARERDEIFSKSIRAGKRTYFLDVKSTRGNELYLTITESKKCFRKDGNYFFEKHKLFLYREDFEKFHEGFNEVVDYIKTNDPDFTSRKPYREVECSEESVKEENKVEVNDSAQDEVSMNAVNEFTNIEFEDLDEK